MKSMTAPSDPFWSAAEEILANAVATSGELIGAAKSADATWHPNGFAVLKLAELEGYSLRLHAWLPDPPILDARHPTVHSHDRHLASIVLAGQKVDRLVTIEHSPSGQMIIHQVGRCPDSSMERVTSTQHRVSIKNVEERIYKAGDRYQQEAGVFHEIPAANHTAFLTLCVKSQRVPGYSETLAGDSFEGHIEVRRPTLTVDERGAVLKILTGSLSTSLAV